MSDGVRPGRAAFFDLDETLIRVQSIFRFLEYHLARRGRPPEVYRRIRAELKAMAAAGRDRREISKAYYRGYAGQSADRIAAQGEAWFAGELAAGDLFIPATLDALRQHRRRGDLTVLVSGSFPPCAHPAARHLGVDLVVCSRPEIVDGHYTGRLDDPVIGPAKADVVRDIVAGHGLCARDCYAYGDHPSDLPMLRSVGHPVVVGDDQVLTAAARESGWCVLRSTNEPTAAANATGSSRCARWPLFSNNANSDAVMSSCIVCAHTGGQMKS